MVIKKITTPVADLRGGRQGRPPPRGPKFFHFHAVFDQKNRFVHSLWELAPPPRGENPGSATADSTVNYLLQPTFCH